MINVFVNGLSAKSGGGLSVLTNFLKVANKSDDDFRFIVAVPKTTNIVSLNSDRIKFISLGSLSNAIFVPITCSFVLPLIAKLEKCDVIFNLADIPMVSSLPQVFLFDWPYAAFPYSPAWHLGTLKDKIIRKVKFSLFKRLLPFVKVMIAQNDVLRSCIGELYGLRDVLVVPNAVSLDNLSEIDDCHFELGDEDEFKLLCLSRYYSHKNIEIFLPVAQRIKNAKLPFKIITTVSPSDGDGARSFIEEIRSRGLSDVIVNLGTVQMKFVPALYRKTDALILPTLLESFSGTYVEAMFHEKVIITSDLPFATVVCGDGALYFDPLDDAGIFERICQIFLDKELRLKTIEIAKGRLELMPTWEHAYSAYTEAFRRAIGSS